MQRAILWTGLLTAALCGCADEPLPDATTPDEQPERVHRAIPPPPIAVPRSPLLIDGDLGGWTPSDDLLLRALALGDPDCKTAALAGLEALEPGPRVDTLRAGLRLRDEQAAIACAARVEWQWLDNWECARSVALLTEELFRPGTEADFEKYRSYMGSVDVNGLLRAIPDDGESALEPGYLMGQLHRVLRAEHILPLYELSERSSGKLADGARSNLGLLSTWSDRHRVETAGYDWDLDPADFEPPSGDGLHPMLAAVLRRVYLIDGAEGLAGHEATSWLFRWMMDSRPGPRDVELIIELIESDPVKDTVAPRLFHLWLGLLPDPRSDGYLRAFEGSEWDARIALARRGDADELKWLESVAHDGHVEFGVFLEAAPERARAWMEAALLGEDDERAIDVLELLDGYVTATSDRQPHMGITWRQDLFDGFEDAVARSDVSASRRGSIAVTVPGCRTRRLARQVVAQLDERFFDEDDFTDPYGDFEWFGYPTSFLEVAAPVEFRRLLRDRIRDGDEDERAMALPMLWTLGDAEASALLVEHADDLEDWEEKLLQLARSASPAVVEYLRGLAEAHEGDGWADADAALAAALGLPERTAWHFGEGDAAPAPGARAALLDGRPKDALALQLAAHPDELFDVGEVRDPRVRSYLERLRRERHLEHYWLATAELALQDADAREELWSMLQDGRYRTQNCLGIFTRTVGRDLSTIPFWLSELESQCCRINLGGGQIFDKLFELEDYACPWETSFERISRHWERHGGRFVWSRLAERLVPAPE